MPEKPLSEEEAAQLRARVRELEAQLAKKDDKDGKEGTSDRRASDSWADATRSKRDGASRMARAMTLASIEGLRLFADSLSAFADGVVSRNDAREHKSARDLATRLPGDVMGGFADAVDRFVEIPAKTAEKYSSAYREGEKSK